MGESAEVLLGEGQRRTRSPAVHWHVWVRLRVHGPQRSPGDYLTNGQDLPHNYPSPLDAPRRGPGRPCWDWENGDSQGPGKGHGCAVCGD